MGQLGVHFALNKLQKEKLIDADKRKDVDRVTEIIEEIEEDWCEEFSFESDKSWDAMHRCLSDGTLNYHGGSYPLNAAILAGQRIASDEDYCVVFINENQVKEVAKALQSVDYAWLTNRYWQMDKDYAEEKSEEDMEYTWEYLQKMQIFFEKAASAGRSIIFTVDQ